MINSLTPPFGKKQLKRNWNLSNPSTLLGLLIKGVLPPGYTRIPYHFVHDIKFDGRRKSRLVLGSHRTPDVPDVEVYSGVVSIETVRTAFVLTALNNLQVCAADVSTAFLYGKTQEKVYIVAGDEFGEDAANT